MKHRMQAAGGRIMTAWVSGLHAPSSNRILVAAILCAVGTMCHACTSFAVGLPDTPFQTAHELAAFLAEQPFEIGFYAKALHTDIVLERFAERHICLASIVKLFCLTELYRRGEWFPEDMPPKQQMDFLRYVTDCLLTILASERLPDAPETP